MVRLEDRLRPPANVAPWPRDVVGVGLLIALAVVLLPLWNVDEERYVTDVAGQMASFYLLPALGFLLALRCGAIDLSVWVAASLGGVVAALLINAGLPPAWAFAAAAGSGLALGAVNAALTALARLPSPAVTLATALLVLWGLQAEVASRQVAVPEGTFDGWHLPPADDDGQAEAPALPPPDAGEDGHTLDITRMLIIALAYAAVLVSTALWDAGARRGLRLGTRWRIAAALAASGMLAALGGACWLIERNQAPVLALPAGDLRIPVAAVLAGGAFLAGPARATLAALCLPAALLFTTLWRTEGDPWDMKVGAYALHVLQFGAMVLAAQLAAARLLSRRRGSRWLAGAACALAVAGLLVTAGSVRAERFADRAALYAAGTAVGGAGLVLLLASWLLARRRRQAPAPGGGLNAQRRTGRCSA